MAEITPQSIFEQRFTQGLKERPEVAKEIGAVIQFDISGPQGGTWTIDFTKADGWVSAGPNSAAKMTVSMSDADLVQIAEKKLNPTVAAMSGRLRFKPMDMTLALKLGKIF